jgi:hypothetical protein
VGGFPRCLAQRSGVGSNRSLSAVVLLGKFLERRKAKTPDGMRQLTAEDFTLGQMVEINRVRFILTNASEFTYKYMEESGVSRRGGGGKEAVEDFC